MITSHQISPKTPINHVIKTSSETIIVTTDDDNTDIVPCNFFNFNFYKSYK